MVNQRNDIIEKIFEAQDANGSWKLIPEGHANFPTYLHYVPNYKASLWVLLLLADLQCDKNDPRVRKPLETVKNHLFDEEIGIYTLKDDHFPIPCLNGNMLYLDAYFNAELDEKSKRLLSFFSTHQRFDDGKYELPKNQFCTNTSCYGKHTCYWGVVKLLKGISFIAPNQRTEATLALRDLLMEDLTYYQFITDIAPRAGLVPSLVQRY